MTAVKVNDPEGRWLGNVKAGDTKRQALERLGVGVAGGLFDKEGIGLLHDECVVVEGGPYVFRSIVSSLPQQQQSHPIVDVTIAWMNSVSDAVERHADYGGNNILQLAEFLKTGPSNRAPIHQTCFHKWKTVVPEPELLKYFQPVSGGDSCQALSDVLTVLLLYPMHSLVGENEDGYHGRIDQCISEVLFSFAPEFKLRRNSVESCPLKRPDFSATILGKGCYFRGEEKKLDSNEDPRVEL